MVGIVMLKPGWLNLCLPAIGRASWRMLPPAWASSGPGLMLVSPLVNAYAAPSFSVATWALVMSGQHMAARRS